MNVQHFLKSHGMAFDVIPHRDACEAQRLAKTIHVSGRQVAKTVLLRADGGYAYVVAVLRAMDQVDIETAAELLGGSKLELATEEEISANCPDGEIGVLPPFGSQCGMKTLVDARLAEAEEIIFECDNHQQAIRMRFDDYRRLEEPLIGFFARTSKAKAHV